MQFIHLLQNRAGQQAKAIGLHSGLRSGIGDDCAIIKYSPRKDLLVTTDLFIEGIHFRRRWQEARSVGHKALARALSDIAAMGGTARFVFLSLGLPPKTDEKWLRKFFDGFFALAASAKVVLAGGDTGKSPRDFFADVIVTGELPAGKALLRSGARPGDQIWVSGKLGLAAAALRDLESRRRPDRAALQSLLFPEPRLRVGQFLRERKLASAMIDISDGLSLDLWRLCEASEAGAKIIWENIPRPEQSSVEDALHGGEDLELLFTVPPRRAEFVPHAIGGIPLTCIGQITSRRKLLLAKDGKESALPILGFQHF